MMNIKNGKLYCCMKAEEEEIWLFGGEKFSTSALLKNVVALNSLKLMVKKLHASEVAQHVFNRGVPKIIRDVRSFRICRGSYDSVVSVANLRGYVRDPWTVARMIVHMGRREVLDVPTLNNFHKVDTLF